MLNPGGYKPFSPMVKAGLGTVMKKFPRHRLEFYPPRSPYVQCNRITFILYRVWNMLSVANLKLQGDLRTPQPRTTTGTKSGDLVRLFPVDSRRNRNFSGTEKNVVCLLQRIRWDGFLWFSWFSNILKQSPNWMFFFFICGSINLKI